jgi:hypothetical protein
MAINKAAKNSPTITVGKNSPILLKITPEKVGDLFVDTTNLQLFFAVGLAYTSWGTCGTAGG